MPEVIILAGKRKGSVLQEGNLNEEDALLDINGIPMIQYVINALRMCKYITNIVVCGNVIKLKRELSNIEGIILVDSGETILDTLKNGIRGLKNKNEKVLIVTSDIPLLTTGAIEDFINNCCGSCDIYYPIVHKHFCLSKFPNVKRTYVRLKEGEFTGGNIFMINPEVVEKCESEVNKLYGLRKSPLKLANYMGLGFIIKYLTGSLSLDDAQNKVSEVLGINGKGVISTFPEIGLDVDKPSDLELVRNRLLS